MRKRVITRKRLILRIFESNGIFCFFLPPALAISQLSPTRRTIHHIKLLYVLESRNAPLERAERLL